MIRQRRSLDACSFCVQSTILSALVRSLYSRGSTTVQQQQQQRGRRREQAGACASSPNFRGVSESASAAAATTSDDCCKVCIVSPRAGFALVPCGHRTRKTTQWWQRKLLEIDLSVNRTINHYFTVRRNVQNVGQLSLQHVAISKTERNRTTKKKPMSSSYNTPWIKHKLEVSIYANTETSLAMSTLAIWCRVVQSRDVSPHNFDGLAMSGLAFSVAPSSSWSNFWQTPKM